MLAKTATENAKFDYEDNLKKFKENLTVLRDDTDEEKCNDACEEAKRIGSLLYRHAKKIPDRNLRSERLNELHQAVIENTSYSFPDDESSMDVLTTLIKAGFDVTYRDQSNPQHDTLLHKLLAGETECEPLPLEFLELILEKDPDALNRQTAAFRHGPQAPQKYDGSKVVALDSEAGGETPLHFAVNQNHDFNGWDNVENLIALGANIDIPNLKGETPRSMILEFIEQESEYFGSKRVPDEIRKMVLIEPSSKPKKDGFSVNPRNQLTGLAGMLARGEKLVVPQDEEPTAKIQR